MQHCITFLLDLSTAFDTVDHPKLLCDLKTFCTTGFTSSRFTTYLTDRKLKVIVNYKETEIGRMNYGVQQGKILDPVFLHYLYANYAMYVDLLQCIISLLC